MIFYPKINIGFICNKILSIHLNSILKSIRKRKNNYNKENTQWNYLLKTTKFGRRFYLF